ncbi:TauD/TfdA family dioxygenase [Planomonospora sp. ID67723]|uniref:TauD/TfdA family dioxygenase n=1 Tax=Planomonospora sp. ID67723 TaxID=2738134 RepID=UPI0018C37D17|nr:TauD/TfdA family dioxygenase [Planomonospora sp. ID67723]MBG0830129.1 TauD/TfdA family dioxygenase [Planomonospora sp. ID67723]
MLDRFVTTDHTEGKGLVVTTADRAGVDTVDRIELMTALAEHGYVVLRGFDSDPVTFSALIQSVSSRITLDPARKFAGGNVAQKIEAGLVPQGLHVENGATPWVPDLVWFYCETPAKIGSQTTICDGLYVWDRLPARTQELFLSTRITFARPMPEDKWKNLVFRLLDGAKSVEQITFDDLLTVTDDDVDVKYQLRPDGSVHYKYFTYAAHTTLFGTDIAFANSILTPSVNYEPPVIEFEDGRPLDAMLMRQVIEATELETDEIDWHEGDIALVDNSRLMHGRRKIRDPRRSLYNAQSYAKDDIVGAVRELASPGRRSA